MKMLRVLSIALLAFWMAAGCAELTPSWSKGHAAAETEKHQHAAGGSAPSPEALAGNSEDVQADDETVNAIREYIADLQVATAHEPSPSDRSDMLDLQQGVSPPGPTPAPMISAARPQPETRANQPMEVTAAGTAESKLSAKPVVLSLTVSDPPQIPAATEKLTTVGANQGMDIAPAESVRTFDRLIEQAAAAVEDDPANASKQWKLSLLYLAAGQPGRAAEISPAIAQESRAFIADSMATVSEVARLLGDPVASADNALASVNRLREVVRQRAELSIPTVALCSRVSTFGIYDELPETALMPYRSNRVIVYCEIANFHSEIDEAGLYHTTLSSRLELLSDDGQSRWVREENRIEDVARRQREDFFLPQLITLPPDLSAGDYVLKVTITDLAAGRTNEANHRFTIPGVNVTSTAGS